MPKPGVRTNKHLKSIQHKSVAYSNKWQNKILTNRDFEIPAKEKKRHSVILKRLAEIADKIINAPVRLGTIIGSSLLFLMMLVRVVDVVGRYFFQSPLHGADEATGLLFLCVIACAFSYTQKEHKHIRVEVFTEHFSGKVRKVLDVVNNLISVTIFSLVTWQLSEAARKFILNLQGGSPITEDLLLPLFPFYILLAFGFAIYTLLLLRETLISIAKVINR